MAVGAGNIIRSGRTHSCWAWLVFVNIFSKACSYLESHIELNITPRAKHCVTFGCGDIDIGYVCTELWVLEAGQLDVNIEVEIKDRRRDSCWRLCHGCCVTLDFGI